MRKLVLGGVILLVNIFLLNMSMAATISFHAEARQSCSEDVNGSTTIQIDSEGVYKISGDVIAEKYSSVGEVTPSATIRAYIDGGSIAQGAVYIQPGNIPAGMPLSFSSNHYFTPGAHTVKVTISGTSSVSCAYLQAIINGNVDSTSITDADGDGYPYTTDCNDNNPTIHPGANDLLGDGIDQNCDGVDGIKIPQCTESSWYSSLSSLSCPSTGKQTKTWTRVEVCENGIQHPASEEIQCIYNPPPAIVPPPCTSYTYGAWTPSSCISGTTQTRTETGIPAGCSGGDPALKDITSRSCVTSPVSGIACTLDDWQSTWGECQSDRTQTKTWSKKTTSNCQGGQQQPANTVIACNYYVPPPVSTQPQTCVSFSYGAWSLCPSNSIQTRTEAGIPTGCVGGDPITMQTCIYVPPALYSPPIASTQPTPAPAPTPAPIPPPVSTTQPASRTNLPTTGQKIVPVAPEKPAAKPVTTEVGFASTALTKSVMGDCVKDKNKEITYSRTVNLNVKKEDIYLMKAQIFGDVLAKDCPVSVEEVSFEVDGNKITNEYLNKLSKIGNLGIIDREDYAKLIDIVEAQIGDINKISGIPNGIAPYNQKPDVDKGIPFTGDESKGVHKLTMKIKIKGTNYKVNGFKMRGFMDIIPTIGTLALDSDGDGSPDRPGRTVDPGAGKPPIWPDHISKTIAAKIDCDDKDPSIKPGGPENFKDWKDNNCNGLIDCADFNSEGRACGYNGGVCTNQLCIAPEATFFGTSNPFIDEAGFDKLNYITPAREPKESPVGPIAWNSPRECSSDNDCEKTTMINSNLKEEKLTCKSGGGTSYLLFTAGKTNVCCFENDPVVYDSVQNRFVCGPRNLIYTSILDKVPREINLGYTFKSGSNAGNNLGYEEMPGYFPVSRSQDQMISYIAVRSRVMKAVLDKDTINKLKAFKPKLTVDYVDENDKLVAPSKIAECQIEKIPVDNTQEMVIFYRCDVQPFSLGADFRGYKIRFRAYVQNYRYAKEQKKEDLSIGSNFDVISWFNYYFIKEKQNQPDWGKTASYYYALLDKLAVPTKIDTVENGKILAGKPVYIDWKNSKSKVSDYAPRVDSLVGDEKINVCNQTLNPTSYIYNYYIKSRPPKIQSSFGLNYNNDMDFLVWDTYLDEAQKCDKDWYDYAQEALTQPGKDLGRIVSTPVLHMIALASKVEPEKTVQKVEKVTEYATVGGAVVGVLKIFPAGAKTVVGVIGIPVSWVYENVFKKAAEYLGLGETRGSLADLGELKYGDVIRSDAVGDKAVIEALARNYGECSQRTLGEFDKDLQAHGCTVKFPNCCQEGETSKYVGAVVRTLSRTSIFGFGMGKLYDALNINEKIFNLCGKEDSCKGAPYNIGLPTLPPYYATGNVENSELVYINKDLGKGPFTNKAIVYPDLVKKLNAASKKT